MAQKDVVVFGLGRFGNSVSMQLEKNGYKVLAVDSDEKKVNQIAEYVTLAVCADVVSEEAMNELGISNFSIAIVAIGRNMEAAVLATIWAKEHGVTKVIAKALNETQGKILQKVGADEIIFPESEVGRRVANNIALNNVIDAIELTDEYSIADIPIHSSWAGKTIKNLNLRKKYGINVIAIKRKNENIILPQIDMPIGEDDIFVVLGANRVLKKLSSM